MFFTDIEKLKEELKKHGNEKRVITTGCFDVLHQAHEDYLKDGKSRGDVFVVLLQSDEMVSKRKGTAEKPRPIFTAEERVKQLSYTSGYKGVIDYILLVKNVKEIYKSIEQIRQYKTDVLVLSEATENDETSPKVMEAYFKDEMQIDILAPKSEIHSSDIIDEKKLRPARLIELYKIKLK